MERKMKVEDILLNATQTLNGITLPAAYAEAIVEIARIARNIQAVYEWLTQEAEKQQTDEETDKKPVEADAERE